ncbi:ArnT family glycosyltransferase [Thalassoglobus sp.]|uniref:ArnT family glycosyltransferase n=1 Tax=Thalassoglobus sp. TaxID=2795869 RepID=UPI003AA9A026
MIEPLPQKTAPTSRQPPNWCVGLFSFILCWTIFVGYYHFKFDLNGPPSTSGDEVDYDSIGWELAHGRGFVLNSEDPEFREPYDVAAKTAERFKLEPRPHWEVTYRPPLYPYAISYLNRLFGRQFWATRIMDAGFMAGTLALIVMTLYPRYGWQSVVVALGLFIVIDVRTRLYGRAILTEPMSLFFTSIICVALLRLQRMQRAKLSEILLYSALIGFIFGFSLLARTMMILWVPGMCLTLYWIIRKLKFNFRQSVLAVTLYLVGTGVVLTPWAVRNIKLTEKMMPLGTQGLVQLSAGFGDSIWESKGVWPNIEIEGFFDVVKDPQASELEYEIAKAEYSKAEALKWIRANPMKVVLLTPIKMYQECRPRGIGQWIMLVPTLLGVWSIRRTPLGKVLLAVFAMNLFAIAATWSVEGRFLVPVLFPIHIFATIGLLVVLQPFLRKLGVGSTGEVPTLQ